MHTTAPTVERDATRPGHSQGAGSRIRQVVFWAATLIIAGELAAGSVWNLVPIEWIEAQMGHLGYPHYFAYILGVWQAAACLAIMAPRLPLLKEWAYAGTFFLWTGAVVSHLSLGDGPKTWGPPLGFAVLGVLSWALRPADRRLPETRLSRAATQSRVRARETRPRAWALPVVLVVGMFAASVATLPAAEELTREWAVEYGWIEE